MPRTLGCWLTARKRIYTRLFMHAHTKLPMTRAKTPRGRKGCMCMPGHMYRSMNDNKRGQTKSPEYSRRQILKNRLNPRDRRQKTWA